MSFQIDAMARANAATRLEAWTSVLTYDRRVLNVRPVFAVDGLSVADVACRHDRGRGTAEPAPGHMLVVVRRGCFVRTADGVRSVLDPTTAYCTNPGEEQRYDHPLDGGDDCTAIGVDATLAASVLGGQPDLPAVLPTSSPLDLAHRVLLAAAHRGVDTHQLYERTLRLVADALADALPARVASGSPAGVRARRALADAAREALAERPERSLPELARELAVSPHHLSRVFSAVTGHTVSRHRMRLRTRAALGRLVGGETDLAALAADLGFADQSHLCRVLRSETGSVPSALRRLLNGAGA
jgi:AraC-like DNA-binding protein